MTTKIRHNSLIVSTFFAFIATTAATPALASEFSGAYGGVDLVGGGRVKAKSDSTNVTSKNSWVYGINGGYNWVLGKHLIGGIEAFYDDQRKKERDIDNGSTSLRASSFGVTGRLGYEVNKWLPYFKLGMAQLKGKGIFEPTANGASTINFSDYSSTAPVIGLGAEYKAAPHWTVGGEINQTRGKSTSENNNKIQLTDNMLQFKVRYYMDAEKPVRVLAAAPVVEKPEPARAVTEPIPMMPAPQPAPPAPAKTCSQNLVLPGALFEFNKAALKPEALEEINAFVARLKQGYFSGIKVVGYTDRLGSDEYNLILSKDRAESVAAYLGRTIPPAAISATGKGKANPISKDCTGTAKTKALLECLAPDRRVEIIAEGACK